MSNGYDVGELVAEIWVDTSTMSKGIEDSKKILQGFESKIVDVSRGVEKQTRIMEKSFQTMSNGMELHLDAILGLTQEIRNGFRQMGAQMNNSTVQGQKNMEKLSSGFRTVREGIDHCVIGINKMNRGLAQTGNSTAGINKVNSSVQNLARSLATANVQSEGLFEKLSRISLFGYILYQDLRFMVEAVSGLFAPGMKFAVQMENSMIGMSAIMVSSFVDATGAAVPFNEAMGVSAAVMQNMRNEALRTTATLEELLTTFQAILGPGVEKGMNMQEIQDIAVMSVNAVKAMGLRKDQLVQEIRSILTGNITARSSTVATALGITNTDIDNAKNQIGGVAEFLKKRFEGFKMMANEAEDSFFALFSNIEDGLQQSQEKAFSPFFRKIKDELKLVQDLFFTITRYEEGELDGTGKRRKSDEIKEATLNPKTVALFREMATIVDKIYFDTKEWGIELYSNYDRLQYIKDIFTGISQMATALYDNFAAISKILFISWTFTGGWARAIFGAAALLEKLPALLQFIADHLETILTLWAGWTIISNIIRLVYGLIVAIGALEAALVSMKLVSDGAFLAMGRGIIGLLGPIGWVIAGIGMIAAAAVAAAESVHGDTVGKGDKAVDLAYASGQRPEAFENIKDNEVYGKTAREKGRGRITNKEANELEQQAEMLKKQEEYEKKMNDLMQKSTTWKSKWDKEDEDGKAAKEAAKEALAEISSATEAALGKIRTYQKELQYQYDQGIIAVEDYFNSMKQSYIDEHKIEVDALNEKIKIATKHSDVLKLQGDIAKKNEQLAQKQVELGRKRLADYRQFFNELATIHSEYMNIIGSSDIDAKMESLYNKYSKQILSIENFSKGFRDILSSSTSSEEDKKRAEESLRFTEEKQNQLRTIIEMSYAQAGVDKEKLNIAKEEAELISKNNQLKWEYNNGLITELDYKQKIYDMDKAKLQELMPYYEKQFAYLKYMHETSGNPVYLQQMEELRESVRGLQHDLSAIDEAFQKTFVTGLEDALVSMMNGTKTFSAGLKDMVKSMQNIVYKQVAKDMAQGVSEYLKIGKPTNGKDAFSDPEARKRIDTMVNEMKTAGKQLYDVFHDSSLKVKNQIDITLLPALDRLATKIDAITATPTPKGEVPNVPVNGSNGTTDTITGVGTTTTGSANKIADANNAAIKDNTTKFMESTNKLSIFAASLATVSGNEGLMKFATALQLFNNLIGALKEVGAFGGTKAASGGYISGPGTSTSDSIPARLSDGEYVIRAASVKKYGVGFLDAVNKGRLPQARFANGGLVAADAIARATDLVRAGSSEQQPSINLTINPAFYSADPYAGQKMFEQQMPYMRSQILQMMRTDPAFRNAVKGAIR